MQIHVYMNIRTQSIHKVIDLHLDVDTHNWNDDAIAQCQTMEWVNETQVEREYGQKWQNILSF